MGSAEIAYLTVEQQIERLRDKYKHRTMLRTHEICAIFGWNRVSFYRKYDEFARFGDIPVPAGKKFKAIHKEIVFAYYCNLYGDIKHG